MTLESEIPIGPTSAPAKLLPILDGKYDEKCRIRFFREFLSDKCEEITSDSKWAYQLRIFWYPEEAPSRMQPPWNSIQHRIKVFLLSFENFMPDYWGKTAFVQFWEPVTAKDGRRILSVLKQPFAVRQYLKGLCRFRYYCEELCRIGCRTEVGYNFGPVGRAFTRGSPEFSPHVDIYSHKDFPFKRHAENCGVAGYLALPIFELRSDYIDGKQPPCVGVLEFISFTKNVLTSFDTGICMKKLKEVGLAFRYPSHSEALTQIRPYFNFPSRKGKPEEIISVLDMVRKAYNLPLIQIWLPCICYGSEVFVTCEPYGGSFSKITHLVCGLQCVNRDDRRSAWLSSYGACDSEVYFVENGESWVGRAHLLKKIRFVKDIRQYSISNYPLVNLCHSSDLLACFAVPLQIVNPKLPPLVLELFLPTQLNFEGDREDIINPILSMVARELSKYYVNFGLRQDYVQNRDYQPLDATGIEEIQVPTEENERPYIAPCHEEVQVPKEENKRPYIAPCHEPSGNGRHSDDRRKTPAKEKPWLTYVRRKNKLVHCGVPAVEDDHAQHLQHKPNDAIEIMERQISTEENMRPSTIPCHEPLAGQSTLKRGIEIKERQVATEENITVPCHEPLAGQSTITLKRGRPSKRPAQQILEPQNNSDDTDQQSEKRFCPSDYSKEKQDEAATVSIPIPIEFPVAADGRVANVTRKRGRPRKRPAQQIPELQNNSDDADQQSKKRFCPSDNSKKKQDEAATVSIPIPIEFPVPADGKVASIGLRNNVVDQGPSIPSTTGKGKNTKPENDKVDHGTCIPTNGNGRNNVPEYNEVDNNCSTIVKVATVSIPISVEIPVATDGRVAGTGLTDNVVDHGLSIPSTNGKGKNTKAENDKVDHGTSIPTNGKGRNNVPEINQVDHNCSTLVKAAMVSIPIPVDIPVTTDGRVTSIGLGNNVVDQGPCISPVPPTTGKGKNTNPENDEVDHGKFIPTNGKGRNNVPKNDEVDHECSLIVKARYKDDIVKFPLSSSSGIEGLRGELLKRFELEVGRFKIKYPEAGDWFLLSCSEDLSFHMGTLASAGQTILELSIFSTT